jgi:hypothetical protein
MPRNLLRAQPDQPTRSAPRNLLRGTTAPSRPPMPSTGTPEEFGQNLVDFANRQAGITATHYRNLANLPGSPLGENMLGLVREPTPEEQQQYQGEVVSGALSTVAGVGAGAVTRGLADTAKWALRGGKDIPTAAQFLADNAVRAAEAAKQGVRFRDVVAPPVAGTVVGNVVDASNLPQSAGGGETVDKIAGGLAGAGTAGLVAKQTLENVMLRNPRWQQILMRPSAGSATTLLGALAAYLASRGLTDHINDAADYVAGLFEEQPK